MKRIACFVALTALMYAGGVSAQKPTKGDAPAKKNEPRQETKKRDEAPQRFVGTIVYNITPSKKAKGAGPVTARSPKTEPGVIDKAPANATLARPDKQDPKEKSEKKDLMKEGRIVYNEEGCFALMGEIGAWCIKEEPMSYLLAFKEELFSCEPNVERWKQMQQEAKKLYIRTDHSRMIAGRKATLYQCAMPGLQGEIWVAEDLIVTPCALPFPGLRHPVLEGDFTINREEEPLYSIHFSALNLMPKEVDEGIVKRCHTSIMLPQPEFYDRVREIERH